MISYVIILIVAFVAWRYRRVLGLSKQWDQHGRAQAEDLAAKLGWTNRQGGPRTSAPQARQPVPVRARPTSFYPKIDTSRLPTAVAIGALFAIIVVGLDLQGYSILSFLIGIVVGPIAGGLYVRSRWWLLVAPAVAIIVGAGGEIGALFVAFPVAALAYAGIRADIAGWLARLNAQPDES